MNGLEEIRTIIDELVDANTENHEEVANRVIERIRQHKDYEAIVDSWLRNEIESWVANAAHEKKRKSGFFSESELKQHRNTERSAR